MTTTKKLVIAVIALSVALVSVVGGTLAWLWDKTGPVTNTFTVGLVDIELDEAKVNLYGVEDTAAARVNQNRYKLIPGHTYVKDPTVWVKPESEACYVFVKVENGLESIMDAVTIEDQILAKGWTKLDGVAGVYYKTVASRVGETEDLELVVFENFKIKNDAKVADYTTAQIVVTAYAVQQDQLSVTDAWDAVKNS